MTQHNKKKHTHTTTNTTPPQPNKKRKTVQNKNKPTKKSGIYNQFTHDKKFILFQPCQFLLTTCNWKQSKRFISTTDKKKLKSDQIRDIR